MKKIKPESQRQASDNAKLVISATDDQMFWFFMGSQYFLQVISIWLAGIGSGELTAKESETYLNQRVLNVAVERNREDIMQDFLLFPWHEHDFKELSQGRLVDQFVAFAQERRKESRTEGVHGPPPNIPKKLRSLVNILFNWAKEKDKK